MDVIYTSIANLGFPIVISLYLLVRIEGKLNDLTESISELSKAIAKGHGQAMAERTLPMK